MRRRAVVPLAATVVVIALVVVSLWGAWQTSCSRARAMASGLPASPGVPEPSIRREIGYSGNPDNLVLSSGYPLPVIRHGRLAIRIDHRLSDRSHSAPGPMHLTTYAVVSEGAWRVDEVDRAAGE